MGYCNISRTGMAFRFLLFLYYWGYSPGSTRGISPQILLLTAVSAYQFIQIAKQFNPGTSQIDIYMHSYQKKFEVGWPVYNTSLTLPRGVLAMTLITSKRT